MTTDTMTRIIGNIFKDSSDKDSITFSFQGGEPTVAGLSWFQHFVENVALWKRDVKVQYTLQTNGFLLDEYWCEFFHENNFLIGLSIDGGKRFHDRNRFSSSGEGTHRRAMQSKCLLEKNAVEYNVLCVLTSYLAKEPEKIWRFIIDENIRYVQFIPCLEPLSFDQAGSHQSDDNILRPALFAQFYSRLLPLWMKEFENKNYISVKLFDDVVNYFMKGIPTSCGIDGRCHNQYVIEADGSVFPCDFYAVDQYKIGNLTETTPREIFCTETVQAFFRERPEHSKICESCVFFPKCQGGCKRMRNVVYAGVGGAICGFRSFLEKCLVPLEIAVRQMITPGVTNKVTTAT